MKTKRVYSLDEKRDIVLAYLKEKYGEEFVAKSMIGSDWSQSYDKFYVYPKNGSKENTFAVWYSPRDDGTYHLSDGYFGILIKDKYEAVVSGFVKEIYKDFKLYTDFGSGITYPDRLNRNTKICEIYYKDEHFSPETRVYVKQASAEEINIDEGLKRIAQKMIENKLAGKLEIYVVNDDKYELIGTESFKLDTKEHKQEFLVHEKKRIGINDNLELYGYGEVK